MLSLLWFFGNRLFFFRDYRSLRVIIAQQLFLWIVFQHRSNIYCYQLQTDQMQKSSNQQSNQGEQFQPLTINNIQNFPHNQSDSIKDEEDKPQKLQGSVAQKNSLVFQYEQKSQSNQDNQSQEENNSGGHEHKKYNLRSKFETEKIFPQKMKKGLIAQQDEYLIKSYKNFEEPKQPIKVPIKPKQQDKIFESIHPSTKIKTRKLQPLEKKNEIQTNEVFRMRSSLVNPTYQDGSIVMLKKNKQSDSIMESNVKLGEKEDIDNRRYCFQNFQQRKKTRATFTRDKSCLGKWFYPEYKLRVGKSFILNSKLEKCNISSRYNISCSEGVFDPSEPSYMGHLKSNFTGSLYNLYLKKSNQQELVATIHYISDCGCSSTFRNFEIYIKNQFFSFYQLEGAENNPQANLMDLFNCGANSSLKRVSKFINKKPIWNQKHGCYTLSFKGKMKRPSIKNFILIQQDKPDYNPLLFCKHEDDQFYMEMGKPLSPFLAFGIAVSSFDFKISSQ